MRIRQAGEAFGNTLPNHINASSSARVYRVLYREYVADPEGDEEEGPVKLAHFVNETLTTIVHSFLLTKLGKHDRDTRTI